MVSEPGGIGGGPAAAEELVRFITNIAHRETPNTLIGRNLEPRATADWGAIRVGVCIGILLGVPRGLVPARLSQRALFASRILIAISTEVGLVKERVAPTPHCLNA